MEWFDTFIAELTKTANVSAACRAARISRTQAYDWRGRDPVFAAQWDEALAEATDDLESEARRRAMEGTERPVFYMGNECGAIREYSDQLMVVLLKAHRPEKYREKTQTEHSGAVTINVVYDDSEPDQVDPDSPAAAAPGADTDPAEPGPV